MPIDQMIGGAISAATSLFGGSKARKREKNARQLEYERQREFAQSGIQWKVSDAKAAGIHPLYALGAGTTSYAPQHVGGSDSGISAAGQHLGRAINATSTLGQRNTAFNRATQNLTLERMELENQLLKSKIATSNQVSMPPAPGGAMLIDGQPGSGLINEQPMKRQSSSVSRPYQEAGAVTDLGYTKTKNGYMPVMSEDAKKRLDDDFIGMLSWNIRNRLLPTLGINQSFPNVKLPKGYMWHYDEIQQQYRPIKWRRR